MREAVLNAIVHSDYSHFNPIGIRVYENKVIITNMAKLPQHISFEELLTARISFPHNPNIARAFYKNGQIALWGRGLNKIITECEKENKPKPIFNVIDPAFQITFENNDRDIGANSTI
jgi:ATP-dependent DNA helicase RecG